MTRHPDEQDPRPQDQGHGGGLDAGEGPPATQRSERPGGTARAGRAVERVQTGVRMEKRLVKVLKALAELYDLSLGDLLEGIVLHAFAGRSPFSAPSLRRIAELERIYGLDPEPGAGVQPLEVIEHPAVP